MRRSPGPWESCGQTQDPQKLSVQPGHGPRTASVETKCTKPRQGRASLPLPSSPSRPGLAPQAGFCSHVPINRCGEQRGISARWGCSKGFPMAPTSRVLGGPLGSLGMLWALLAAGEPLSVPLCLPQPRPCLLQQHGAPWVPRHGLALLPACSWCDSIWPHLLPPGLGRTKCGSRVTPRCLRRAPHPSVGLPSCSQAGPGTVSSKRFPSRGLRIMHLEQHSLIQVCDLSENQIPVISPAIWPCVCGPRTGGWTRTRAGGRVRTQGSSVRPRASPRASPRHHSKHPPKQCPKHHPKHRSEHPPSHGGEGRGGQGQPRWGHPM